VFGQFSVAEKPVAGYDGGLKPADGAACGGFEPVAERQLGGETQLGGEIHSGPVLDEPPDHVAGGVRIAGAGFVSLPKVCSRLE
jgi:hypothetical protein